MQPHVYIITVNYNNADDTIQFIESLQFGLTVPFSCMVIDNSSNAASSKAVQDMLVQKTESGAKVYFTSENSIDTSQLHGADFTHIICANRGFAAANNIALSPIINNILFSNDDYVFVVNNDTIIEKGCIEKLIAAAQINPAQTGITAPLIYYYDENKIWSGGGWFYKSLGLLKAYHKGKATISIAQKSINFLTGCAWLIQIDKLRNVTGLLDEAYFMYYEDLDYSLHVCEQGYQLKLVPEAILKHKIGASSSGEISPFATYWMMRGRVRTLKKHNNLFAFFTAIFVLFFTRLFYVFPKALLQGNFFIIKKQCKGFWDEISNHSVSNLKMPATI